MRTVTFACVLVSGYVGYQPEYVRRLASTIARRFEDEHELVVLTDRPGQVSRYVDRVVEVPTPPHRFPWWAKVELFKPGRFRGRVCYLDLDTLPVRNLHPIVDYPARFALVPHAGKFEGKGNLKVVKRFNSSVMVWDAGECDDLYTNFTTDVMARLWGDQDWIGESRPHARAMPLEWFPRLSEFDPSDEVNLPADARVVLCKRPKNHEAASRWPWFREAWGA